MSTQGNHPKGKESVPPKTPGHDQMPMWKRMADTSRRFIKRDPQLAPLAAIILMFHLPCDLRRAVAGTIGMFWYFQHSKVTDVAKESGFPRHSDTKASGRGSPARTVTAELPTKKGNQIHNESEIKSTSGGLASYLYPNLDESDKNDLENVTVRPDEGRFGRTIKQAAVRDEKRKDRDFEEKLKEQQDAVAGKIGEEEAGPKARSEDHLAGLQGRKRTM